MEFIIVGIICVFILMYVASSYNKAMKLKNYVKEAFSTMDVYLKQRWDLIPNLVESVKGFAHHEKELLSNIAQLRGNNYSQLSNAQKIDTNSQLEQLLTRFMAIQESYPEIKANESFMQFNNKLSSLEDDIATSRRYYNGTVRELNTFLDMFPTKIIGAMFKIEKEMLFEIAESERENVKVSFND